MARREDPIILSVSALLRLGLIARASFGGNVSSLSSISGWSAGTIIVPEDLRVPSRGRVVSVVGLVFSSPSELEVDVWLEATLGMVEGSAIDGTGLVEASEAELVGAACGDMMDGREVMVSLSIWAEKREIKDRVEELLPSMEFELWEGYLASYGRIADLSLGKVVGSLESEVVATRDKA